MKIQATTKNIGTRLDVFLTSKLDYSRAQVAKMIKDGIITSDTPIKASQHLKGTEKLHIILPSQPKSSALTPQNIPLDILYNDEHIVVINKPKALSVHPGAGIKDGTLCNALLYHFPNMEINHEQRPGLVHRLDKDTSGVMVIALTTKALTKLSDDFKDRKVEKIYHAWCYGEIEHQSFSLKTGHIRHPYNRLRFLTNIAAPKSSTTNIRMAHTDFKVLLKNQGISKIEAKLHTGRTHQIRAHLADIGHPLLGDLLYGGQRQLGRNANKRLKETIAQLNGQALHARKLYFKHPISNKNMEFIAEVPEETCVLDKYL